MSKKDIIEYYDECEVDYKILWNLKESRAMHYGFWDENTRNFQHSLQRFNEVMAETAGIKENDRVLDAGCGVGGSSIFLAKKIGCKVAGISLCRNQVEKARESAKNLESAKFYVRDYMNTGFKKDTFDVVWALESACYSDKRKFVREAFRLLKKGGRLIVADGFLSNDKYADNWMMRRWLNGWAVDSLASISGFRKELEEAGFRKIVFRDVTKNILYSSERLFRYSFIAIPVNKIGRVFGVRNKVQEGNAVAAFYQYLALKKGLWKYCIFYAEK